MNTARSTSQLQAISAMGLGLAVAFSMLAFTYVFGTGSVSLIAIVTYGALIVFERGLADYKQSFAIADEATFKDDREGASATVARATVSFRKIFTIPFILINLFIIIGIVAVVTFVFTKIAVDIAGFNSWIWVPVGTMMIHFAIIRPLFIHKMNSGYREKLERRMPKITVKKDGLEILLLVGNKRNQHKFPKPVHIAFSEIDSIAVQNYQQVQAMKDFEIGEDIDLAGRHAKDMFMFMRMKIDRPRVFYLPVNNLDNTHITIQGKDLLYVMAAPKEPAEAAKVAWEKSRKT